MITMLGILYALGMIVSKALTEACEERRGQPFHTATVLIVCALWPAVALYILIFPTRDGGLLP